MVSKYTPQPIPEAGKQYWFFDDGKIRHSNLYQATVLGVLDPDKVPAFVKEAIEKARKEDNCMFKDTTDKAIRCSVRDYDVNDIWLIRTKEDAWLSVSVESCRQGGLLDVDNHLMDWLDSLFD